MTKESAPAFLMEKKGAASAACYRLGLQVNQQKNMDVELYDVTDPAMGVNIKYTEGDYCCPYTQCQSYLDVEHRDEQQRVRLQAVLPERQCLPVE